MKRTGKVLQNFLRSDSGATAVEYGILAAILSLTLIAGVSGMGARVSGMWNSLSNTIGNGLGN